LVDEQSLEPVEEPGHVFEPDQPNGNVTEQEKKYKKLFLKIMVLSKFCFLELFKRDSVTIIVSEIQTCTKT
jgi:hypothetical protein